MQLMDSRILNPMANQPKSKAFIVFATFPIFRSLTSPQGGTEWSGVCSNLSRILIKEVACPHSRAAGVMIEGGWGGDLKTIDSPSTLGVATNSHSSATKNMYFVGFLSKTDTCQLCSHQLDMGCHHFGVRSHCQCQGCQDFLNLGATKRLAKLKQMCTIFRRFQFSEFSK